MSYGLTIFQLPEDQASSKGSESPKLSKRRADRYLGGSLWEDLSAEIHGIRDVLYQSSSDEDDDHMAPDLAADVDSYVNNDSFMYSPSLGSVRLIEWPSSAQRATLFAHFLTNVDLPCKILHVPSVKHHFAQGIREFDASTGSIGLDVLKFAVYYAAITSLSDEECSRKFGQERSMLLRRFRSGTEYLLAKADLAVTEDMSTLQALVLYLVSLFKSAKAAASWVNLLTIMQVAVRSNEVSRRTWTMTSLAVRVGQAIGIHRVASGGKYELARPFDAEMRSRLWWQICLLDRQSSNDRGSDPILSMSSFNVKMPHNVNDEDLDPDASEDIWNREGFTTYTFSAIAHESFIIERRLNYVAPGELSVTATAKSPASFEQKIQWVEELRQRIELRYLRHFSTTDPRHRYAKVVATIIVSGLWLFAYRPLQKHPDCIPPTASSVRILQSALEVLEHYIDTRENPDYACFRWVSRGWVQWHPLAVLLAELCVQTTGPLVERAWLIVPRAFAEFAQLIADSERGRLWLPVKKLMNKAQTVREQHLAGAATTPMQKETLIEGDGEQAAPSLPPAPSYSSEQASIMLQWTRSENTGHGLHPVQEFHPGSALGQWSSWQDTEPLRLPTPTQAHRQYSKSLGTLQHAQQVGAAAAAMQQKQQQQEHPGTMTETEMSVDMDLSQMAWESWEDFLADSQCCGDMNMTSLVPEQEAFVQSWWPT